METHTEMLDASVRASLHACSNTHIDKTKTHYGHNCPAFVDGPFPKVSLKHLPAGNLHRVPVVHTVWGKHTLCKWFFFFWNGTHTTRDWLLMATVSAKVNSRCECFLICPLNQMYIPCRIHTCPQFPCPNHIIHVCTEECKCGHGLKAGNEEKRLTPS